MIICHHVSRGIPNSFEIEQTKKKNGLVSDGQAYRKADF